MLGTSSLHAKLLCLKTRRKEKVDNETYLELHRSSGLASARFFPCLYFLFAIYVASCSGGRVGSTHRPSDSFRFSLLQRAFWAILEFSSCTSIPLVQFAKIISFGRTLCTEKFFSLLRNFRGILRLIFADFLGDLQSWIIQFANRIDFKLLFISPGRWLKLFDIRKDSTQIAFECLLCG